MAGTYLGFLLWLRPLPKTMQPNWPQRVIYRVALLTHKLQDTASLAHLIDLVQTHVPTRALRSSDAHLIVLCKRLCIFGPQGAIQMCYIIIILCYIIIIIIIL